MGIAKPVKESERLSAENWGQLTLNVILALLIR